MKSWWIVVSEQKLYVGVVVLFISGIFGIIVWVSANTDSAIDSTLPSQSPMDFPLIINTKPPEGGEVAGVNSQGSQFGPVMPLKSPSPTPKVTPSPSPLPTPSPSPSPSPSPTPTPTPTNNNSSPSPTPTPTPSPSPSPSESPSPSPS